MPNTSKWLPNQSTTQKFKDIFYKRCLQAETIILHKVKNEQEFNIHQFDSGLSVEEIIREQFSEILPKRYLVTKGIINDRNGFTSGDNDLIIFNELWFPLLKQGATNESRKLYFPIEGVYSIGEIKQTLNLNTLDDALEKLVINKRLHRPKTGETRIVENREFDDRNNGFTNPLYAFIIAVNLESSVSIDDIFERFFEINKTLKRSEIINSLCILQKATITWANYDTNSDLKPATFSDNFNLPIIPVLLSADEKRKSSLYDLIMLLLAHLYNSILGAEDLPLAYGNNYSGIKIPQPNKFMINPQ